MTRLLGAFLLVIPLMSQRQDPIELVRQAKQLIRQPGKGKDAMPLLQEANRRWEASQSRDPAYAESLDLYVQLAKASQSQDSVQLQPLARRALEIYDQLPDTPIANFALALEIESDLLGREGFGAQDWTRATELRSRRVAALYSAQKAEAVKAESTPAVRPEKGMVMPMVTSKADPDYTESARLSKISGAVQLSAVINQDGRPQQIRLERGCGYGLDEKAAEALNGWKFRPAMKDGRAVPVAARIEVNFQLTENAPDGPKQVMVATPKIVRIGGKVAEANLIKRVQPTYPDAAKAAGVSGIVSLSVLIGTEGMIEDIQLVSGDALLAPAATEAVRHWVYKPTLLNGSPVKVMTSVNVQFTLSRY